MFTQGSAQHFPVLKNLSLWKTNYFSRKNQNDTFVF